MNLRKAIIKSARKFYEGELPEKAIEASDKEFVYTLDFFDAILEKEPAKDEEIEDGR